MSRAWIVGSRIAVLLAIAATMAIAGASPVSAGLTDNKTFTVDVHGTTAAGRDVFAGDADATIALTLTNTSPSQQLGSANVTVPDLFNLRSVSDPPGAASAIANRQVIQLRNLALAAAPNGGSVTVTLTVDVRSCVETKPGPFAIQVKQSNDFKGTGNDFFVDPNPLTPSDLQVDVIKTCSLAFVNQPADAEHNANITSLAYTPTAAPPVTVEVLDGGNTGRATSSSASITLAAANQSVPGPITVGNASATASAGLASFTPGPTLSVSAFGYTFAASSDGLTSSDSSVSFAIVDDAVGCKQNQACDTTAKANNANGQAVAATFGSGPNLNTLTVSLGAADAPGFSCTGYSRGDRLISQFVFSGDASTRVGTFAVTIPNASNPVSNYEVCWASTANFTTKSGLAAPVGGTKPVTLEDLHVGLLPDCPNKGEPTTNQMPCVASRVFNRQASSVTITVKTSGADPWAY